ncbi:uncharacterized protein [Ptychodera flava]|uniref:uncharacterized protein n=1 Tax=Ptychodera flava TaxID=63121 RepID=UPI003969D626
MKQRHNLKLEQLLPVCEESNPTIQKGINVKFVTRRRFDKKIRIQNAHRRCHNNLKSRRTTSTGGLVVNLSDKQLDNNSVHLLGRGLGFCPKPQSLDKKRVVYDCASFTRKVRLLHHFSTKDESDQESATSPDFLKEYKPKKKWTPKPGTDKFVDMYCSTLLNEAYCHESKHADQINDNITSDERKSLNELRKDKSVVITKADKGGSVVILNRIDYEKECLRQLSDTNFYEEEHSDCTPSVISKLKEYSNMLLRYDIIGQDIHDALCNIDDTKEAYFYILPKIHKLTQDELNNHVIPPGRPICSHINSPCRPTALWLDHILTPVEAKYCGVDLVKDTTEFLAHLEEFNSIHAPLPDNLLIITMDVRSLYTNIPHSDGLTALNDALQHHSVYNKIEIEIILQLVLYILSNNHFSFLDRHFRQVQGTAMGIPFAVKYANIFMAWFRKTFLLKLPLYDPLWHKRFVDDLIELWYRSRETIEQFIQIVNTVHPSIKFDVEFSKEERAFLDVRVIRHGDRLETNLYIKPTDSGTYLSPHSCHPRYIFRSVP